MTALCPTCGGPQLADHRHNPADGHPTAGTHFQCNRCGGFFTKIGTDADAEAAAAALGLPPATQLVRIYVCEDCARDNGWLPA
jgi:hypothetical protein